LAAGAVNSVVRAMLVIEAGGGAPSVCELTSDSKLTLGRHRDNMLVLHDEHASRWHAEVFHDNGHWYLRDFGGLNGTRLEGEPVVQQAELKDGQVINIGTTCLRFSCQPELNGRAPLQSPPQCPVAAPAHLELDQTILRQDELTILCKFMSDSVRETEANALISRALETVHAHTAAAVTGFLSLDRDNPLPRIVLPKSTSVDIPLSRKLTQAVQETGKLVRLGALGDDPPSNESLLSFTDAVCVPLQIGEIPFGALHVYRSGRHFAEREVRFCEILAGHLASTLNVLRIQRTLTAENSRLRSHSTVADHLVGKGSSMQLLRQRIDRLAPMPVTVLIVGESGVGKELVALALHRQSPRHAGPMVSVNCAAIAPTLLESELFGHCKGAFSGAHRDHPGYFEQADGGTLFLDEIGELSAESQAKLLRVLETKSIRPVGGTADLRVDVRILAATHRDLQSDAQTGRFRQDLLFRLQGILIQVPPLREHPDDIPDLVDYFLERLAHESGREVKLGERALDRLQKFLWPGNVRQLRSVLESAVLLSDKSLLEPGDLPLPVAGPVHGTTVAAEPQSLNLEDVEAWAIRLALARTAGNRARAAQMLGIVRDTLTGKMKKYGINKPDRT